MATIQHRVELKVEELKFEPKAPKEVALCGEVTSKLVVICKPPFFGTIPEKQNFDKVSAATALKSALDGDDAKEVIKILTSHNNAQRREIENAYYEKLSRDLRHDLKHDMWGNFEDVAIRLLEPPRKYDAIELHKALAIPGTDEKSLIEILVTRSNAELKEIRDIYQQLFHKDLIADIESDTSGHFRKLVVALAQGQREEGQAADLEAARSEAQQLFAAGEDRLGTDEHVFISVLTKRSFAQLQAIFKCYRTVAHHDFKDAVKAEMSGNLKRTCLAIVAFAKNPAAYFAERIHDSVDGWGTKDRRLIRQIISRSEIDLALVKEQYAKAHDESLLVAVKCDTSGHYRDMLLEIIKGPVQKRK